MGGGGMGGTIPDPLSVDADPTTTTFGASGVITTDTVDVTLTASGEGSDTAIIYYTTNLDPVEVPDGAGGGGGAGGGAGGAGGAPASSTMEYTGAITIDATTVLKFLAVVDGGATTPEQSEGYTLTPNATSADWANSGHGDITAMPWRYFDPAFPGHFTGCAKCHSAEGVLDYSENGALDRENLPTLGLECSGCHGSPFNVGTIYADLGTYPELDPVVFPSADTATFGNSSNVCMVCHQGNHSTVSVDEAIDDAGAGGAGGDSGIGFLNIHYYAAAASLFGTDVQGGYEYAFQPGAGGAGGAPEYVGQNMFTSHGTRLNDCVGCHMDPDGGSDNYNHVFVPAVTDCAPCHGSPPASFPELSGTPAASYQAIQALQPALLTAIEDYAATVLDEPIVYEPHHPYWFNADDGEPYLFDPTLLRAAYNYQVSLKEPAGYIHNGAYIQQLLHDSITDLGGTAPGTRP
jgi:hypothetical protein